MGEKEGASVSLVRRLAQRLECGKRTWRRPQGIMPVNNSNLLRRRMDGEAVPPNKRI
jgi:hypothetical protein